MYPPIALRSRDRGYVMADVNEAMCQRRPTFCWRWVHAVAKASNLGFAI